MDRCAGSDSEVSLCEWPGSRIPLSPSNDSKAQGWKANAAFFIRLDLWPSARLPPGRRFVYWPHRAGISGLVFAYTIPPPTDLTTLEIFGTEDLDFEAFMEDAISGEFDEEGMMGASALVERIGAKVYLVPPVACSSFMLAAVMNSPNGAPPRKVPSGFGYYFCPQSTPVFSESESDDSSGSASISGSELSDVEFSNSLDPSSRDLASSKDIILGAPEDDKDGAHGSPVIHEDCVPERIYGLDHLAPVFTSKAGDALVHVELEETSLIPKLEGEVYPTSLLTRAKLSDRPPESSTPSEERAVSHLSVSPTPIAMPATSSFSTPSDVSPQRPRHPLQDISNVPNHSDAQAPDASMKTAAPLSNLDPPPQPDASRIAQVLDNMKSLAESLTTLDVPAVTDFLKKGELDLVSILASAGTSNPDMDLDLTEMLDGQLAFRV